MQWQSSAIKQTSFSKTFDWIAFECGEYFSNTNDLGAECKSDPRVIELMNELVDKQYNNDPVIEFEGNTIPFVKIDLYLSNGPFFTVFEEHLAMGFADFVSSIGGILGKKVLRPSPPNSG